MKKILISIALLCAFSDFIVADNSATELTGDTKLACEAILCLSSNEKPSECEPSLHRYFSIHYKKWHKTLSARKDFLKLCPVGEDGEKDAEFRKLRDDILVQIENPCDLNSLNSNIERKIERVYNVGYKKFETKLRINPNLSKSCLLLMSSKYTNIKPKYTCNGEFYTIDEWNDGYKKRAVDKATYELQKAKNADLVESETNTFYVGDRGKRHTVQKFYVKEQINKKCWVME